MIHFLGNFNLGFSRSFTTKTIVNFPLVSDIIVHAVNFHAPVHEVIVLVVGDEGVEHVGCGHLGLLLRDHVVRGDGRHLLLPLVIIVWCWCCWIQFLALIHGFVSRIMLGKTVEMCIFMNWMDVVIVVVFPVSRIWF